MLPVKSVYDNSAGRGVAMVAGMADGIAIFNTKWSQYPQCDTFLPTTEEADRELRYGKWRMAIERSLGWSVAKRSETMTDERYKMLASVPAALYVIGSFVMLALSNYLNDVASVPLS